MKDSHKLDRLVLQSVTPEAAIAYLRRHGWKQIDDISRATVWQYRRGLEVLVPSKPSTDDYYLRVAEMVRTVARVERRDDVDVLDRIRAGRPEPADLIRIHLEAGLMQDGTIPIEPGLSAFERARELIFAAACSAARPRAVYYSRRPQEALSYMERVRLAPSERGSFVLVIRSPITAAAEHGARDAMLPGNAGGVNAAVVPGLSPYGEAPYERQVTMTLVQAVRAAQKAAEKAPGRAPDALMQHVQEGVSANLCEALAGLVTKTTATSVMVTVEWSPVRPVPADMRLPVKYDRAAAEVFDKVARVFRERSPEEDYTLVGRVCRLSQLPEDLGGDVTIINDEDRRYVRVRLSERDYDAAVKVHHAKQRVQVLGTLRRHRRRTTLEDPHDFRPIPMLPFDR